ncbi:MAG: MobC family plasmid mobilization relaxosome protein [gamma proteobacterium symbiont of Bathyaustriella thionipta]|nr:MobC family plasmid mobilization relaxosome protein [gamma proteobacterium symbiont of Bathyaustriella thionipta]MCU7949006.1 MobC family plasmid mobilization relaxosome protein [gamma proteobacterium symbiont of Bathyaustriella thionipta]MCU7952206.1 MobC family plasmid mobilization relaxosome protein [gamma proteobacterium symbiont of Bathyaustriella thionipta]MCU7955590.1 MobC family plasmid mobilization relaxosome protein [gamma proteobacterium symbiont of Bathyaustriella thionipta]MCU79
MSDKTPNNQQGKKTTKYPAPFCMRFTRDERKTLELAAGDRPLAAYIRWLIFKEEIPVTRTRGKKPVKDHKEIARLLAEFGKSRIANNINQLAKAANSGSLPVNVDVLKALNDASRSVHWIRQTLIKALGLQGSKSEKVEGHSNDPESQ